MVISVVQQEILAQIRRKMAEKKREKLCNYRSSSDI
jgi:hypothetical protein